MAKKAPGKAHREGMTIVDLMDMFPTAATEWFETIIWPDVAPNADRSPAQPREDALLGARTAAPISA